ncbi:OmpA family protein [Anderseniella sp. Alg231-50]|uniref:OmpA family protein n=1 Tax=Anderseniella sp. Alg231-50 TaxID=1922226 RepID=UPI00307CAE24
MKRVFQTSMLGALVVAAGLALAPVGSMAQSKDQVKQMSVEQLLQRQQVLRGEIDNGGGKKQKRQLRRVQRELKRRKNQAAQPQPAQPQPVQQQQEAQPQPQPKAQPVQQQQDQSANVNRLARRYLRNNANVRSMKDNQLQTRIRNGRNLLQQDGLSGKLKRQVRDQVKAARAETARRAAVVKTPKVQPVPQQQVQPALQGNNGDVKQRARRYLRNKKKVRRMSDAELQARIRDGNYIMERDKRLGENTERRVLKQLLLARDEKARRAKVANQPQPDQAGNVNRQARRYLQNDKNVRRMSDAELQTRIRNGRNLLQRDGLRNRLKRQVRDKVQTARAEADRRSTVVTPPQPDQSGNVNRQARRYLLNDKNVRRMSDGELRTRIRNGRNLLQRDGLRNRLERQVREQVRVARSEVDRRSQVTQQPASNVNREARDLLADNRSAASLRDPQLRRRLERARRIMGDSDLNRPLFRQVRRMARTDRDELRDRVARRDQNRAERREDRLDARQLLRDRRDVRDLNDRQLQRRIKSARDLLASNTLRAGQKERLRDLLREARREKRRRLIAGRADRRERLRRNRDNNQIIIQIPPVRIGPDRDDIAAAEADDELLEQQLVAPPRRRIERKFSRQEFRSGRPSARDSMPAIEVDTIRFGFNESFVREEEIPQLERIGEIIERIIAANPNEVFLIEGHTDAVGSAAYNQGLSSKRANAVRDAMLQFFNIERTNIETVGYGEEFLKIETEEEEAENRRVTIRRITPLLASR